MSEAWTDIAGDPRSGMLLVADHASNRLPPGIDLGMPPAAMEAHVAWDIGVAPLATMLCAALDCPAVLGGVSRLLIDLNREEDTAGLIPGTSDGHAIPVNTAVSPDERRGRIDGYWRPYHDHIAEMITENRPRLLISLHSFTPQLSTSGEKRPWEIGILYNQDDRAARIALPHLVGAGIVTGDNLPYSGKVLNATMNRHGEANGIPYLGVEVRQDLIDHDAGVQRWAARLMPMISAVFAGLAERV